MAWQGLWSATDSAVVVVVVVVVGGGAAGGGGRVGDASFFSEGDG